MADLQTVLNLARALPPVGKDRLVRIERLAPAMSSDQLDRLYATLESAAHLYVQESEHVRGLVAEAKGLIHGAHVEATRKTRAIEEERTRQSENAEAEALIQSLNTI